MFDNPAELWKILITSSGAQIHFDIAIITVRSGEIRDRWLLTVSALKHLKVRSSVAKTAEVTQHHLTTVHARGSLSTL
jgi:hypothetical protein